MKRVLTMADVEAAIKGGSVYAAGGGGWVSHGRMLGTAAVNAGLPELVSMDEVPDDAWIATAAAIGAPAGTTEWQMVGRDYVKAVELLQEALGEPIHGLMIGQNGRSSTMNAWLPSAILGTKVVDAVGDVRAHPTGDMGSLGLASSDEPTIQTAVGGNRARNSYLELVVRGVTRKVSPVLRTASDMSGGFIASCRNPVRASFVKKNAALGGISLALSLGEVILKTQARAGSAEGKSGSSKGGSAVLDAICEHTRGRVVGNGRVARKDVRYTHEAFDVGTIGLGEGSKQLVLHVMNEYMALDDYAGDRLATYPDVLATLDAHGEPVSVGDVSLGQELFVLHIPRSAIPLSASVRDPSVYPIVERALGIEVAKYAMQP